MYQRKMLPELQSLATQFRVITLIGPRQAGKTTLCKLAFPDYQYVSMEDPDIRFYAEEDPRAFLKEYRSHVIIDEVQRVPSLLSYIQSIVDEDAIPAQFVLTGSHQLKLKEAISQSLAGRTALLSLLPLSFEEIPEPYDTVEQSLLNGFMPGKLAQNINTSHYYRSYFQTYIERDVSQLINLKDSVKFENFVRLCAGRVGQLFNHASLATEVGVSAPTIHEWLSVLEASFVVFRLQPYFENFGKRMTKSPKLYFVDTGLAAWLLGIENERQMQRDPLKGNLFENMMVIDALKARLNRGKEPRMYFFRDSHGNEVDLVMQSGRQLIPVEIKSSQTWQNSYLKGLKYFEKLVGDRSLKGTVIYAGEQERDSEHYRLLSYSHISSICE